FIIILNYDGSHILLTDKGIILSQINIKNKTNKKQ
ncbi:MAG: hypothetical protein ACJAX0_001087, partial [Flavobacteriales bacterium]